jgi:hypothetical protein
VTADAKNVHHFPEDKHRCSHSVLLWQDTRHSTLYGEQPKISMRSSLTSEHEHTFCSWINHVHICKASAQLVGVEALAARMALTRMPMRRLRESITCGRTASDALFELQYVIVVVLHSHLNRTSCRQRLLDFVAQKLGWWSRHRRLSATFCVVQYCAGRGLAIDRSPIPGTLSNASDSYFQALKFYAFFRLRMCNSVNKVDSN